MRTYVVTLSFMAPVSEKLHKELMETLNSCGNPFELLDPVCFSFILESEMIAPDIGKRLCRLVGTDDKFLVVEITRNLAWFGLVPQETARRLLYGHPELNCRALL